MLLLITMIIFYTLLTIGEHAEVNHEETETEMIERLVKEYEIKKENVA